MNEEVFKLVSTLNDLYESNYKNIEPLVLELINNNIKDINLIESYLDTLLSIPTDKSYILLKRLCDYYKTINKENADFYIREYKKIMK